jgi:hypothetical protein
MRGRLRAVETGKRSKTNAQIVTRITRGMIGDCCDENNSARRLGRCVDSDEFRSTSLSVAFSRQAGLTEADKSRFDHLIPLALGGAPNNLGNLALKPWSEATKKDVVEPTV